MIVAGEVARIKRTMSNLETDSDRSKSRLRRWMINLFILVLAIAVMLALAEGATRWLDGFQLSTLQLKQDTTSIQPDE